MVFYCCLQLFKRSLKSGLEMLSHKMCGAVVQRLFRFAAEVLLAYKLCFLIQTR